MVKRFVGGLVALAVTWHPSLLAEPRFAHQTPSPRGILRSAAAKIEKVEPNWRFIPGVCNYRGPLLPEQVGIECGLWEARGEPAAGNVINVSLHIISSADAASDWISARRRKAAAQRAGPPPTTTSPREPASPRIGTASNSKSTFAKAD
jgi:hypothetical protein